MPREPKKHNLAPTIDLVSQIRVKAKQKAVEELVESHQLPLWDDDKRGLPNSLARGALFTAGKNTPGDIREFYEDKRIASLNGLTMEYRGQELRQDDASVFMTLLHLGRLQALGDRIHFTAYSMLKDLGWSINSVEYKHLRECCARLSATNVSIMQTDEAAGYAGSLVRAFSWKGDNGKQLAQWWVELEPPIAQLFAEKTYTMLEWMERKTIGGRAPLALWLHSYLGTHREPFNMSVEKYRELSASRSKDISDFRRRLKQALQKLVEIGFLKNFSITNDIVRVARIPKRFAAARPAVRALSAPAAAA